jgi:hypothetical protein
VDFGWLTSSQFLTIFASSAFIPDHFTLFQSFAFAYYPSIFAVPTEFLSFQPSASPYFEALTTSICLSLPVLSCFRL